MSPGLLVPFLFADRNGTRPVWAGGESQEMVLYS